uniref:Uncharacterized protein n=1 Tax=Strongyloides venezuelensis TaxID=75913 RepID=A0A0K0F1C3_STRVS
MQSNNSILIPSSKKSIVKKNAKISRSVSFSLPVKNIYYSPKSPTSKASEEKQEIIENVIIKDDPEEWNLEIPILSISLSPTTTLSQSSSNSSSNDGSPSHVTTVKLKQKVCYYQFYYLYSLCTSLNCLTISNGLTL